MTKSLTCGCTYDGPVQVLTCPDHNVAARNLNRAQAMLVTVELERDRYKGQVEALVGWLKQRKIIGWEKALEGDAGRHA